MHALGVKPIADVGSLPGPQLRLERGTVPYVASHWSAKDENAVAEGVQPEGRPSCPRTCYPGTFGYNL